MLSYFIFIDFHYELIFISHYGLLLFLILATYAISCAIISHYIHITSFTGLELSLVISE